MPAQFDLGLGAEDGVLKLDGQIKAQVVAALLACSALRTSAHIEHFTEQIAEDVADVHTAGEGTRAEARALPAQPGVAVAVVGGALLRVAQHLVGFAGGLELLFSGMIAGVEQILSLGAKFLELNVAESGSGSGGYAKELSAEAKAKQQSELNERLKKYDVVITTANVPGRRAPILVTESAVQGMRKGSVIIDMAAPSGGNCALTEPGKIVEKFGVKIVGFCNFAAMVPSDSSHFYGSNVAALLELLVQKNENQLSCAPDFTDDIVAATVVTHQGQVRFKGGYNV
jgi:NAD/NADP transhydrogenase alpha subunit